MNIFQLSWKNLVRKPLNLALSLTLFALGIGLITLLMLLEKQLNDKLDNNLAGINLVVGAKGSPLQMVLCNMYHIDNPTGNISIKEAKPFLNPAHPLIKTAIPLSLGDNYKGYRIVGTIHDFTNLYNAKIQDGRLWEADFEVTVGAFVAEKMGLKIGDTFHGGHSLVEDDQQIHDDVQPFVITGILQPSGSVIDQLVLTNTASIWKMHGHEESVHADSSDHVNMPAKPTDQRQFLLQHEDEEITSLLIQYKFKNFQTLQMQRLINDNTEMMAASPAYEINRLYGLMGIGEEGLRVLAYIIMAVSAFSIFISLYSSLKERKYELALMRVMGSSRAYLFLLVLLEGLIIALAGYAIGFLLGHFGMQLLADRMTDAYKHAFSGWTVLPQEKWLLLAAIVIGVIAAMIPALQAFYTRISQTLADKG